MSKSKFIYFLIGSSQTGKTAFANAMVKQAQAQCKPVIIFKPSEQSYFNRPSSIPPELLIRPISQFKGLQMPEITQYYPEKTSKKYPEFPYIKIPSKKA